MLTRNGFNYEKVINKAERDITKYKSTLLAIANIFINEKKYIWAKKYVHILLKLDKNNYKALYCLFKINFEENNMEKAEKAIYKILNLCKENEDKVEFYYWLIIIYSKKEEKEKKLKYLFIGISIDEGFYIKYKWPVNTLNYDEKLKIYSYFKEKYNNNQVNIKVLNSLIYLSYELEKKDDFYKNIKLIEEYYSEHQDNTYWKIIICINNNDFDKARSLYNNIVNIEPYFFDKYTWEETNYNLDNIKTILND